MAHRQLDIKHTHDFENRNTEIQYVCLLDIVLDNDPALLLHKSAAEISII